MMKHKDDIAGAPERDACFWQHEGGPIRYDDIGPHRTPYDPSVPGR